MSWVMHGRAARAMQPNWPSMLLISALLHVCAFAVLLLVPDAMPTRDIKGTVYEVSLVDLPNRLGSPDKAPKAGKGAPAALPKASAPKPAAPKPSVVPKPLPPQPPAVKKIAPVEKAPEKVVPIAKRTIEKPVKADKPPEASPAKRVDEALSKIEKQAAERRQREAAERAKREAAERARRDAKKAAAGDENRIDSAVARLEERLRTSGGGSGEGGAPGGGGPVQGISLRIYEMEVTNWIKSNWSYPVALTEPDQRKDLMAVVLVKAKNDGTVLDVMLKESSKNPVFDQSVLKAVERSDPLPPFPEGFNRPIGEFEITFNLSEFEGM